MLGRATFAAFDFATGSKIKMHLKDIEKRIDRPQNHVALKQILEHARETVPFYASCKSKEISDFPVVDKQVIRECFDEFRSKEYFGKRLVKMTTSGSTGTPFTVLQDRNKKYRNYADTLYFSRSVGYQSGTRLVYIKIWPDNMKWLDRISLKLRNIWPVDAIILSDEEIARVLRLLQKNRCGNQVVIGYVSALEQILRYCSKKKIGNVNADVTAIICISETLSHETKLALEATFNCPAVSRYSSLECGIIAQQECHEPTHFRINTASYLLEILRLGTDEVAPDGELGRIVITDLFNKAMPLIRYDTGDIGQMGHDKSGLPCLIKVEGRKLDLLFDTSGNLVSSLIMYKNMWKYTEIVQYQLVQTGEKSYVFKINCPGGFLREGELVNEFKSYLGQEADFRVEYVSEIPLLDSGKRRKTLNLYRQSI